MLTWAIPAAVVFIASLLALTDRYNGPWVFIAAVITFGVLYFWFERWPCPRCGKPFTHPKRDLTFSQKCCHCGLDLWKQPEHSGTRHQQRH